MCKPKIKVGTAIIMLQKIKQKIKQSRHDIWELDALDLAIEKLKKELEECSESV